VLLAGVTEMCRPARTLVFRKIISRVRCASVATLFYLPVKIVPLILTFRTWTLDVLDDVRRRCGSNVQSARRKVPDRCGPESSHLESVLALLAGRVADFDIVDTRSLRSPLSFLVVKIDLEDGVGDLADFDVRK